MVTAVVAGVVVVVLAGCQTTTTTAEPEETTVAATVEATTEETVPEKTVVIERTVEAASEPEPKTPQEPVAAPAPSPVPPPSAAVPPASTAPAQVPVPQPDLQGAAVAEPVQPYDNEPSVTGVSCAVWTCRDEQGRTNADIQGEWNAMTPQEQAAERAGNIQAAKHEAIADAWRTPSPPGAPPLQEAAKAAYAAGDRTAGG